MAERLLARTALPCKRNSLIDIREDHFLLGHPSLVPGVVLVKASFEAWSVDALTKRSFGPIFTPQEVAAARSLYEFLHDGDLTLDENASVTAIPGHRIDEALCSKLSAVGLISLTHSDDALKLKRVKLAS